MTKRFNPTFKSQKIPYNPLWHGHPGTLCEPQHHKWFVEHKASGSAVQVSPPSQCSTQYLANIKILCKVVYKQE